MILDYETIISRITSSTNLPKVEIEQKVRQKLIDYQDLISKEGAAHMIANEFNVKLFDNSNKILKIKQIQQGLNSLSLVGKVVTINDTRSFQKNGRQGRIGSLLLGDETGTVRTVIWDEKLIDLIKEINAGDILKIVNAYSKENNGYKEIHLGSKSQLLINPENETVGEVRLGSAATRKQIKDLQENESVEVLGTIVQVFEPKSYNACPVCSKKVMPQGEVFTCAEHGNVPPKQIPILNIFFDDGTGNIRAVLFRDQATKLIGDKSYEELKKESLGKQLILRGRVTKNELFNRIELAAYFVEEAQPEKVLAELEAV